MAAKFRNGGPVDDERYRGREQSQLKHRVLKEYARGWGFKLSSTARTSPRKLWFADCFAGPWDSRDENREDTSIVLGLRALQEVGGYCRSLGRQLELGAIFVEKDATAFKELRALVDQRGKGIDTHVLPGSFEENVGRIDALIGDDAALLFVDPKGWKGMGMRAVARLAQHRYRDVLVNVMFNFVHRFKVAPQDWLREQMAGFFEIPDVGVLAGLDEDELFQFYRKRLKQEGRLPFVADLAVPHPTQNRTWFRLVVGAHQAAALKLFRDTERAVCGNEAGPIRDRARSRKKEERTGQAGFGFDGATEDHWYREFHERDRKRLPDELLARVRRRAQPFEAVWPALLEELHVTVSDVWAACRALEREGRVRIEGTGPRGGMKAGAVVTASTTR